MTQLVMQKGMTSTSPPSSIIRVPSGGDSRLSVEDGSGLEIGTGGSNSPTSSLLITSSPGSSQVNMLITLFFMKSVLIMLLYDSSPFEHGTTRKMEKGYGEEHESACECFCSVTCWWLPMPSRTSRSCTPWPMSCLSVTCLWIVLMGALTWASMALGSIPLWLSCFFLILISLLVSSGSACSIRSLVGNTLSGVHSLCPRSIPSQTLISFTSYFYIFLSCIWFGCILTFRNIC